MKRVLLFLIKIYQKCISPVIPSHCRFEPSCSHYAKEAITLHGWLKGSILSVKRMLSCHPWGRSGYDPVPPKKCKKEEK